MEVKEAGEKTLWSLVWTRLSFSMIFFVFCGKNLNIQRGSIVIPCQKLEWPEVKKSVDSASEAAKAGVPLGQYRDGYKIDLAFDDADVMEEESLAAIIGRQKMQGGESIIQEKTILNTAGKLVLIVSSKQYQESVEGSIPVLIKSVNWMETAEEIDDLFLGDAEVWRRSSVGYAGPSGGDFPLITKEGHNVLDLIFTSPIQNLAEVADSLSQVVGVVEHGVISRIPCTAVIATEDGLQIVDNIRKIEESRV